jgi:hypothetical protein
MFHLLLVTSSQPVTSVATCVLQEFLHPAFQRVLSFGSVTNYSTYTAPAFMPKYDLKDFVVTHAPGVIVVSYNVTTEG